MKKFNTSYTQTIKRRINVLWLLLALFIAYGIIVSELGGGDTRMMTKLAQAASRTLYFGGIASVAVLIAHNKSLLKSRKLLKEQLQNEHDERNIYIHDKSGGLAMSIMLALLFFAATTASMFNMPAFYLSLGLLIAALSLKLGLYIYYGGFER